MKIEEAITKYLEYIIKELNYSSLTKVDYQNDLKIYEEYLKRKNLNYLNITKKDILDYLKFLD